MNGWTSPRLGFRFAVQKGELAVFGPDGRPLRRPDEIALELTEERRRADAEKQRADAEKGRAEKLAAKLRELGVDPDAV